MNRAMVTGIGKILDELEVEGSEPPLSVLFDTQNPLSSIKGGVHKATHLPFSA